MFHVSKLLPQMPFSDYLKQRALAHHNDGLSSRTIAEALANEGLSATRQGIAKMLGRYRRTGSLSRARGSGRPAKVSAAVMDLVEVQKRKDDETTAVQLCAILRVEGHAFSLSTILRSRLALGWTFCGSSYCQMIREPNKLKRLEWAQMYAHEAACGFSDVIFTDETSIQLEIHRRFRCRKRGEPPRNKPRYTYTYIHNRPSI